MMDKKEIGQLIEAINQDTTQLKNDEAVKEFRQIVELLTPEVAEKFYQAIQQGKGEIDNEPVKNQMFFAMILNLLRNNTDPQLASSFREILELHKAPFEPLDNWKQPPARQTTERIEITKLSQVLGNLTNAAKRRLTISEKLGILQTVKFTPMNGAEVDFTVFDIAVENAIGNLYRAAETAGDKEVFITPQMIYNEMTGEAGREVRQLKPAMRTAIWESMEMLRNTNIDISYEPNPLHYGFVSDRIVAAGFKKYRRGSRVIIGWNIWTYPRLFEVATKIINQYFSVPRKLLNVPTISHTRANIELVYTLAQYIGVNQRYKRTKTELKYQTLYDDLKITGGKTIHQRTRDTARKILAHWQESGYISDYKGTRDRFTIQHAPKTSLPGI